MKCPLLWVISYSEFWRKLQATRVSEGHRWEGRAKAFSFCSFWRLCWASWLAPGQTYLSCALPSSKTSCLKTDSHHSLWEWSHFRGLPASRRRRSFQENSASSQSPSSSLSAAASCSRGSWVCCWSPSWRRSLFWGRSPRAACSYWFWQDWTCPWARWGDASRAAVAEARRSCPSPRTACAADGSAAAKDRWCSWCLYLFYYHEIKI